MQLDENPPKNQYRSGEPCGHLLLHVLEIGQFIRDKLVNNYNKKGLPTDTGHEGRKIRVYFVRMVIL